MKIVLLGVERCIAGRLIGIPFKWTAYSCLLSWPDDYMHEAIKILFTPFFFCQFLFSTKLDDINFKKMLHDMHNSL